jgi:hypothetical protein
MVKYATSKEFHQTLRTVWDTKLKPVGFKRCKGSLASYYRSREDTNGFLRFWAQVSQWGASWRGNQFTLNIDVSIDNPNDAFGGSDRFLGYLSQAELSEAEKIAAMIVKRKPRPPTDHWIYNEMQNKSESNQFWKDAFDRAFTYYPGTLKPKTDVWLPYFSVDDVKLWAEFLSGPIQTILRKFERANKRLGEQL